MMADLISRAVAIEAVTDWKVKPDGEIFNAIKAACRSKIEQIPTIDAIPVEWLRRYTAVGAIPSGERLTEGKERLIVHRILNEWQKEQEAR